MHWIIGGRARNGLVHVCGHQPNSRVFSGNVFGSSAHSTGTRPHPHPLSAACFHPLCHRKLDLSLGYAARRATPNKLRFVAARYYDNCSFSGHHDLLLLNIFASLRAPCCTLRSFRPHVFGPAYSLTDSSCPTMQMKKLLGLRPSSHLLVHPSSLHSRAWRYGAQIRRNNLWSCIRHLLCASFVYLIQPFACVPLISPDYCES